MSTETISTLNHQKGDVVGGVSGWSAKVGKFWHFLDVTRIDWNKPKICTIIIRSSVGVNILRFQEPTKVRRAGEPVSSSTFRWYITSILTTLQRVRFPAMERFSLVQHWFFCDFGGLRRVFWWREGRGFSSVMRDSTIYLVNLAPPGLLWGENTDGKGSIKLYQPLDHEITNDISIFA